MGHSQEINELAAALVAVQAEIKPVALDSVNPFIGNKYASLQAVTEAVRGPLAAHGLAVTQLVVSDEAGRIGLETMLVHKSGQFVSTTAFMELGVEKGKSAAQVMGSMITYFRRYCLAALLGVVADDDTDGNAQPARKAATRPAPAAKPETKPAAGNGNGSGAKAPLDEFRGWVEAQGLDYEDARKRLMDKFKTFKASEIPTYKNYLLQQNPA